MSTGEQEDVEALSDALLAAVEEDAETGYRMGIPDAVLTAIGALRKLGIDFVRRYHRLEIDSNVALPEGPVLFVANHGFGGIFDLNVFSILAAFEDLELDRPVTALTHQIAWTLQVGKLLEPFGARPASVRLRWRRSRVTSTSWSCLGATSTHSRHSGTATRSCSTGEAGSPA